MRKVQAQGIAIKTNLAGWAVFAPNLGVDLCVNESSSIEAIFYKSVADSWVKNLNFTALQLEYKYWFDREPLNSMFIGITATPARYNINIKDINRRGDCIPFGINIGYCLPLSEKMNIEFSYGIGALYLFEDFYSGEIAEENIIGSRRDLSFSPVSIGINLSYIIK